VIVVDASVALAWCLGDEQDELAERVLDQVAAEGAAAPAHWPLEVANGLLAAERRGRVTPSDTDRARRLLVDLGVEIVPVELSTAAGAALDAARELGLTAYDAAYLELGRHRGVAVATLDEDLARACRATGVALASGSS
jgi:predicted nucleic acid-binding protein